MVATLVVDETIDSDTKEYAQRLADYLPVGFDVVLEKTEDRDEHWITVRCEYVVKFKLDPTRSVAEVHSLIGENFEQGMAHMVEKLGR